MPSKSKAQHNLMAAVAHSASFAKKVGIPQSVGKDFNEADKGRKFSRGGDMAKLTKAHHMAMAHHHLKMAMGGPAEDPEIERGEKKLKHGEHAVQQRGHTRAMEPKMAGSTTGMKRGGMAKRK
jgi:hypothetical protein